MATRRKYKPRAAPPADVENVAIAAPQGPPAAPPPAPGADDTSPLMHALAAQQHAESLQRQHQHRQAIGLPEPQLTPEQRQMVDQHVDSINGHLTEHWRRFLKSHPSLLTEPYHRSMMHQYALALNAGVPDSSDQMDRAILIGVARDIEHHHHLSQLTSASARPTAANAELHADIARHVSDLDAEAEQHFAEHQPAPAAPPAVRPPPPQRRTMPMSAPPSRDIPSVSGRSGLDNHLTRDEREVARSSWPHLPAAQAEYEYLKNKRRMVSMKADGRIQQG
jgi:hypothetical protein